MKTALVVFGTRPEAIKMAPIIRELKLSRSFQVITCATGQHRALLDQVLELFGIQPDIDLDLMKPEQDLFDVTIQCLTKMKEVLKSVHPDIVLVQGDTTTSFAAGLSAYYAGVPLGHVEAGLRTYNKRSPFPEEVNRASLTPMVDFHFAPTLQASKNLVEESVSEDRIYVTGNTSIDALLWAAEKANVSLELKKLYQGKKLILLTAHRRENFGEPLRKIFSAVRAFLENHLDYHVIYPVHPNPNVMGVAEKILSGLSGVSLVDPLGYRDLVALLRECRFVLTDSGGLQEEAPTLGKPVLVLRENTERPEAVAAGCSMLVGCEEPFILEKMHELTQERSALYRSMCKGANPYGLGTAAKKIVKILENEIGEYREKQEFLPPFSNQVFSGAPSGILSVPL